MAAEPPSGAYHYIVLWSAEKDTVGNDLLPGVVCAYQLAANRFAVLSCLRGLK